MKINKKELGSNVRRGVLTGTLAGFVAGWLAFAGHSKQFAAAEYEAQQDVNKTAADLLLPPVPGAPTLSKLPANPSYRIATGPAGGPPQLTIPRLTGRAGTAPAVTTPSVQVPTANAPAPVFVPPPAAPVAAPAATFAPLPALPPPAAPRPVPTTAPSPPVK